MTVSTFSAPAGAAPNELSEGHSSVATPTWSAWVFFAVAVLAGAWSILSEQAAWIPGLLVAAYSGAMLVAAHVGTNSKHIWAGSFADSPYFLGFLLTLIALYHALSFTVGAAGPAGPNAPALLREAGAALLPTGVGLFFRQLFSSFGDAIAREEDVNGSRVQIAVRDTLEELVDVTRRSLDRDEAALERALRSVGEELEKIRADAVIGDVKRANEAIVEVLGEFVDQRRLFMKVEAERDQQWHAGIEEMGRKLQMIERAAEESSTQIATAATALTTRLEESRNCFIATYDALEKRVREFDTAVTPVLEGVESRMVQFEQEVARHKDQVVDVTTGVLAMARAVSDVSQQLTTATEELSRVASAASAVPRTLESTAGEVDRAGKELGHAVRRTITPLHEEAQQIDSLIGDLTRILTERVKALDGRR